MAEPLKLFAVQLRRLGVAEIVLNCPSFGTAGVGFADKVELVTGVGPFNEQERCLHVFVTAKAGSSETPSLPNFRVTVVGEFHISDESNLGFPVEKFPLWAGRNGAAVLMPFLREKVYNTTQNTGFAAIIFPLVEVPVFKVGAPDDAAQIPSVSGTAPTGAPSQPQLMK